MFAFLQIANVDDPAHLAQKQRLTALMFKNCTVLSHSFDQLTEKFRLMLAMGNMNVSANWIQRSRLWRIVFLGNEQGFWTPSESLAAALCATRVRAEEISVAPMHRLLPWIRVGHRRTPGPRDKDGLAGDCPLTGSSADAIDWTMPDSLREAGAASNGRLNALRVWTTALVFHTLKAFDESYVITEEGDETLTIADAAYLWLRNEAICVPEFLAVAERVLAAAKEQVDTWMAYNAALALAARRVDIGQNRFRTLNEKERLSAHMVAKIFRGHEAVAAFTAPPVHSLLRFQRVAMLLTNILLFFVIEIWCGEGQNCLSPAPSFPLGSNLGSDTCSWIPAQSQPVFPVSISLSFSLFPAPGSTTRAASPAARSSVRSSGAP